MFYIDDIPVNSCITKTPISDWSDDNVFANTSDADLIAIRDYIAKLGAEKSARLIKAKERDELIERERQEKAALIRKSLDEMDARIAANRELAEIKKVQDNIIELQNVITHQQKKLASIG